MPPIRAVGIDCSLPPEQGRDTDPQGPGCLRGREITGLPGRVHAIRNFFTATAT